MSLIGRRDLGRYALGGTLAATIGCSRLPEEARGRVEVGLQRTHARGIDQAPSARQAVQAARRGGVPATAVAAPHRTGLLACVAQQCVAQRGLAGT